MTKINIKGVNWVETLCYFLVFALLSIILLTAPIYQGLYFRIRYLIFIPITSLLFILTVGLPINKKATSTKVTAIEIFVLLLPLVYLTSILWSVSTIDAMDVAFKNISSYFVFYAAYLLAKKNIGRRLLLDVLVLAGFINSFLPILALGKVINLPSVIFPELERLIGFYQYPNTTAAVLGGIFFIVTSLVIYESTLWRNFLYTLAGVSMMLGFILAESKGAFLVFGFVYILCFVLIPNKQKLSYIISTVTILGISLAFLGAIKSSFVGGANLLMVCFLITLVCLAASYVINLLKKPLENISTKYMLIGLASLATLAVIAVLLAFNITEPLVIAQGQAVSYSYYNLEINSTYELKFDSDVKGTVRAVATTIPDQNGKTRVLAEKEIQNSNNFSLPFNTDENITAIVVGLTNSSQSSISIRELNIIDTKSGSSIGTIKLKYRYIPERIARRLSEINTKSASASSRLIFTKDAFKIYKDYIFAGAGGGAWNNLYLQYQSYNYEVKEVHNYYLQTATEVGTLGLLLLFGLLISIVWLLYRLYRRLDYRELILFLGILSSTVFFFAHGAIDFDFSYLAFMLMVWVFLGILNQYASENNVLTIKLSKQGVKSAIITVIAIVVAIYATRSYIGMRTGDLASKTLKTDTSKAVVLYEKAMSYDPYNYTYKVDYGQLMLGRYINEKDNAYLQKAYNAFKECENLAPYKTNYVFILLDFYLKSGHPDDAIALANRLIVVNPLRIENYQTVAEINYQMMEYLFKNHKKDEAKPYVENILSIKEKYEKAKSMISAPFELTKRTYDIIKIAENRKKLIEQTSK